MREAVIVVADLYLDARDLDRAGAEGRSFPALERAGRFGERHRVAGGWRPWLARWLGRADLAGVPVADVAAASIGRASAGEYWIATPVELLAGMTRVHLERPDILRLAPSEQGELLAAFRRTFAGSNLELEPLGDGQLLLVAPGIARVPTLEPARCAGGELEVPQGPAAAPLLRLLAELEMWLHAEPLNAVRRARGAARVTGLWLWGAAGAQAAADAAHPARTKGGAHPVAAFGSDAFLAGLCRLRGAALEPLPAQLAAVLTDGAAQCTVLVVELGAEVPAGEPWSLAAAADGLDRRVIAPALAALHHGALDRLTLLANDTRVTLGRYSGWKRWRRPRAGLAAFA